MATSSRIPGPTMRDDYGLRLLAEMGIDVYVPKAAPAAASIAAAEPESPVAAAVILACVPGQRAKLVDQVERALRSAGFVARRHEGSSIEAGADVQAVVVLGGTLARALGAGLPAQRQAALDWVISADADALARDATGKRALWGEVKRLARTRAGASHGRAD